MQKVYMWVISTLTSDETGKQLADAIRSYKDRHSSMIQYVKSETLNWDCTHVEAGLKRCDNYDKYDARARKLFKELNKFLAKSYSELASKVKLNLFAAGPTV